MQVLIVQLSDIHFRFGYNPINDRQDSLVSGLESIIPWPGACLLLVTGDIAWSGEQEQFSIAAAFFKQIEERLRPKFPGGLHTEFIPGNHDCYLPEEDVEFRKTLVEGSKAKLTGRTPDLGLLRGLLGPQENYRAFYENYTDRSLDVKSQLVRSTEFALGGKHIRVISFNTAFLSQRDERAGTLSIPIELAKEAIPDSTSSDLTISIFHIPRIGLIPCLRRNFVS
jgi:predicted MPP superfamily phosphohydrolase